jgi:hypothetical protein
VTGVLQQKLPFSQRWKHRRASRPKAVVVLAPTSIPIAPISSPSLIPAAEPHTAADRARIVRWVASRVISWPPHNCFCCRRPIAYGAKWIELVEDNNRARFHFDCEPVWRAEQEATALKALGIDRRERE